MVNPSANISVREFWSNYRSEVLFGLVLVLLVVASTFLSRFIPDAVFDNVITPVLNVCTFATAFTGAWTIYRHTDGMRMRRLWAHALVLWGLGDLGYLIANIVAPMEVMNMGAARLTTYELLLGNLLGWIMVLYPTETLRPGWLNGRVVLWQLLPMLLMVGLDYIIPIDLWPVIALYPYALLAIVLTHIRAYRIWCENNFSTMEHIEVQWVVRYCIMLAIIGGNYVYINLTHDHTRAFTQQWFVIFMMVYSTEQILFRKDPWEGIGADNTAETTAETPADTPAVSDAEAQLLAQWMEQDKPYLRPDFQLSDLRVILPKNRTYLSQFINDRYGCSFYQFVNHYRIEEAKRLLCESPEMKITEVSARAGFSSPSVFSRAFSKESGMTPKEWLKLKN